jgi:hypothetical protein
MGVDPGPTWSQECAQEYPHPFSMNTSSSAQCPVTDASASNAPYLQTSATDALQTFTLCFPEQLPNSLYW